MVWRLTQRGFFALINGSCIRVLISYTNFKDKREFVKSKNCTSIKMTGTNANLINFKDMYFRPQRLYIL